MSDHPKTPFEAALSPDVVASNLERRGPLSVPEVLASRDWFDRRVRQLESSGGRRTNPAWSMKRQVPLAPETWEVLKTIAGTWSERGRSVAPGQVAGFLLEAAVVDAATTSHREHADEPTDPRFREWKMPDLFSGKIAA